MKSHYLGKDVALLYDTGALSADEVISAFEANTIADLKRDAKEQVATLDIPLSPDMPVPPDYAAQLDVPADELDAVKTDMLKAFNGTILEAYTRDMVTAAEVFDALRDGYLDALTEALHDKLHNAGMYRNDKD